MMPTPPHTKVTTRRQLPNGDVQIDMHSMYKELSSVSQEIEQKIETSRETLALDLIKAVALISSGETPELTLHIITDKTTGEPKLITKRFTVAKEYYGKGI
jgi:hypothetical protein